MQLNSNFGLNDWGNVEFYRK